MSRRFQRPEHAVLASVVDRLVASGDIQLFNDVVDVILDRVKRDGKLPSDLLVAEMIANQTDDLKLARRKQCFAICRAMTASSGLLSNAMEHGVNETVRTKDSASRNLIDRFAEVQHGSVLLHAAMRACGKTVDKIFLRTGMGQKDNARAGRLVVNLAGQFQRELLREIPIDQDDLGMLRENSRHYVGLGMIDLTHDNAAILCEHRSETFPENTILVDDLYANRPSDSRFHCSFTHSERFQGRAEIINLPRPPRREVLVRKNHVAKLLNPPWSKN
jgi:hypothetical protein